MIHIKVFLKEPTLEEYYYEQKLLSDPDTMSYNAGWEVSYEGYHYETGCIDFPKYKWAIDYQKRQQKNRYFAYVVNEKNEFVGYVNFHYNDSKDRYECGVVIESIHRGSGYSKKALYLLCDIAFNKYGVLKLYDNFEINRKSSKIFFDLGFKICNRYLTKRFKKDIEIIEVCLNKEDYLKINL